MANNTLKTNELIKLRKITINGNDVPTSFVSDIELYESITQPGITGFISIKDYQGLQEIGNVFADDEIKISFYVDDDEANELTLTMKIFTNEGSRNLPLNTYEFLRFGFCSPWLVDGLTMTLSKAYSDKFIHEIITDLLKECGAEIGYIEPTKQKIESFVTPLWTPYHSIKYLTSFAMNSAGAGGYLCWTDMKTGKVNCTTTDYLMKGTLGTYETFVVNPNNIRYSGRVLNMSIESSYDTIRMVNNGLPDTKYSGFNYDKNKIVTSKYNISEGIQTRLGTLFPLPIKYFEKKYKKSVFSPLFPPTADAITDDMIADLIEGREKTNYSMLTSDVFKINIETFGEMSRRAGWLAKLDYPSQGANADQTGDKTGQVQYKGVYLIREIKHTFSLMSDYKQYITLVSDGFKEFDRELIGWS